MAGWDSRGLFSHRQGLWRRQGFWSAVRQGFWSAVEAGRDFGRTRNEFFSHTTLTTSINDYGRHRPAPPSDLSNTRARAHPTVRHNHTGFVRAGSLRPIRSRSGAHQEHPRALRRVVRPDYTFARLHLVHWQSEHEPGDSAEDKRRIRKRIENS